MIKIYIPSKGRAASHKTPALLGDADYKVIVHTDEEKAEYLARSPYLDQKIVTSGAEFSVTHQRKWVMDNLVSDGEWVCFMDDNIKAFNRFPDDVYGLDMLPYDKSKRYGWERTYCDYAALEKVFEETIDQAEFIGTSYCGFSSILNAFFRKKKWKEVSLVVGKMCLVKKTPGIEYDVNINTMEDYSLAVQNIIKFGKVLVNSFVFPVANHYQSGGCGSLEQRAPSQRKNCEYLMNKYSGLFRYKERANSLEGCEICLRFYSENSINKWRETWLASQKNNISIR